MEMPETTMAMRRSCAPSGTTEPGRRELTAAVTDMAPDMAPAGMPMYWNASPPVAAMATVASCRISGASTRKAWLLLGVAVICAAPPERPLRALGLCWLLASLRYTASRQPHNLAIGLGRSF